MITEALRLLITADSQGAVRGIEQVGKTADRELSRSEKSLDRWGNRLTSVGSGLIAFGAVAAYGLGQAAQSAGELEQAVGGTEAVFGSAGQKIDEYAKTAADSVGLSQAAFRDLTTVAGAQLKNLGFSVDEAADKSIQLTEIGADLAATYGGTTQEAVEALGAAFRGEADPAERFGLRLNINTANAKAVALGLAESTSAVDDHARAQAILALIMEQSADAQGQFAREGDTLAGQQQRLSAQFEDLKASIGEGAIPVMKTLADVTSTVVGGLSDANAATGGFLGKAATIATVAALGAGGLSLVVGQAIKMRQTLTSGIEAVSSLAGKMGTLKGAAGAAAGAAGLGAVLIAIDQYSKAKTAERVDELTQAFLANELAATDMAEAFTGDSFAAADLNGVFEELVASNLEGARRFMEMAEAAGASGDQLDYMRGQIEQKAAADRQSAVDADVNAEAIEGTGEAADGAAGSFDNAKDSVEEYSDALKSLFDPLFGAVSAQNGLRDANQEVAEKTAALIEAEKEYGAGSAEAAEAARELSDAQFGASEAAFDQESALLALRAAVEDETVSVDAAKAKLAEWVAQGWITQASADATAAAMDGVTWSMGAIPSGRTIDIGVTGTHFVIGQLDEIARRVNKIAGGRFHVSVGGGGGLTMHTGGIVPGPRGQEVAAVLQAGEGVIPLDQMDRLTGAGRMTAAAPAGASIGKIDVGLHVTGTGGFAKIIHEELRDGRLQMSVNGQRVRAA